MEILKCQITLVHLMTKIGTKILANSTKLGTLGKIKDSINASTTFKSVNDVMIKLHENNQIYK